MRLLPMLWLRQKFLRLCMKWLRQKLLRLRMLWRLLMQCVLPLWLLLQCVLLLHLLLLWCLRLGLLRRVDVGDDAVRLVDDDDDDLSRGALSFFSKHRWQKKRSMIA